LQQSARHCPVHHGRLGADRVRCADLGHPPHRQPRAPGRQPGPGSRATRAAPVPAYRDGRVHGGGVDAGPHALRQQGLLMSPSSRRLLVLPLVALLLGLAAWFMSRNEKPLRGPQPTTVSFPTEMTPRDAARARARRTHQLPTPENAPDPPRAPVDPLLAVLPTDPGAGAVVLEANAIRNSPLGETLLACMGGEAQLAEFRERSGV